MDEDFESVLSYAPGVTVREAVDTLCSIQSWNDIAILYLHTDEEEVFTVNGAFLGAAKAKRDGDFVAWISFSSGTIILTGVEDVDDGFEWFAEFSPTGGGDAWEIHGAIERISAHGIHFKEGPQLSTFVDN